MKARTPKKPKRPCRSFNPGAPFLARSLLREVGIFDRAKPKGGDFVLGGAALSALPKTPCHPERSRSSGEAKDLALIRPRASSGPQHYRSLQPGKYLPHFRLTSSTYG